MHRVLVSALALSVLASPAWAGFGSTATMPVGASVFTRGYTGGAPTFDYRNARMLIQLPLLDMIGSVADDVDTTELGLTASFTARSTEISKATEGVVMPGLGFHVGAGGTDISLHARIGAEVKDEGTGLGVYVVPRLGMVLPRAGDSAVSVGGAVEISAWFAP